MFQSFFKIIVIFQHLLLTSAKNSGITYIVNERKMISMDLIPRKFYLDDVFDDFLPAKREQNMKCDIYEKDGNYQDNYFSR